MTVEDIRERSDYKRLTELLVEFGVETMTSDQDTLADVLSMLMHWADAPVPERVSDDADKDAGQLDFEGALEKARRYYQQDLVDSGLAPAPEKAE